MAGVTFGKGTPLPWAVWGYGRAASLQPPCNRRPKSIVLQGLARRAVIPNQGVGRWPLTPRPWGGFIEAPRAGGNVDGPGEGETGTARGLTVARVRAVLEAPAYSIGEAARYLDVPTATLRYWVLGGPYKTQKGVKRAEPVIRAADPEERLLSFVNFVEAHVLDALRRHHEVSLPKVRTALDYLRRKGLCPNGHPLADPSLQTDGLDLFVERYGALINASKAGQTAMRTMLVAHLRRIDRNPTGAPIRLYPFTRKHDTDEPRVVVIDPRVQYGRPVLVGSGIPTSVIAERYKAGESIEDLAADYGRDRKDIEEAIRCELRLAEAA